MSELITIDEARARVLDASGRLDAEPVEVEAALDRVLAAELAATGDVPPFACSAMDGYALRAGPAGRALAIVGESRAGSPSDRTVGDGEAIRISTGAAIPDGATAVIKQEDVDRSDSSILTREAVQRGQNVRGTGEDMRQGTVVLRAGTRLGAAELGAAIAAGARAVSVSARPRVQVLSTGDELRAPGEALAPGEIHNSNATMLAALASRAGATTYTPVRLKDDRGATEEALSQALERSDVVVVSGGVSVGPHDHVKPALAALGVGEVFWGVSLQPGKPTWFGTRDGKLVFGLPGNPVSAFVTFTLFAHPALHAMQGAKVRPSLATEAVLATALRRNPAREQAVRVRLHTHNGALVATPNGDQGSHVLTSLVGADALARIPAGPGELAAGERIALEPLPN